MRGRRSSCFRRSQSAFRPRMSTAKHWPRYASPFVKVGLYGRPAFLETKLNKHREETATDFCATHRMGETVVVGIQKPLNEHKFEERPSPEGGCYGTSRQVHHVRSRRNVSLAAPRPLEVSIRPRNEPDVGSKLSTIWAVTWTARSSKRSLLVPLGYAPG